MYLAHRRAELFIPIFTPQPRLAFRQLVFFVLKPGPLSKGAAAPKDIILTNKKINHDLFHALAQATWRSSAKAIAQRCGVQPCIEDRREHRP